MSVDSDDPKANATAGATVVAQSGVAMSCSELPEKSRWRRRCGDHLTSLTSSIGPMAAVLENSTDGTWPGHRFHSSTDSRRPTLDCPSAASVLYWFIDFCSSSRVVFPAALDFYPRNPEFACRSIFAFFIIDRFIEIVFTFYCGLFELFLVNRYF